jgi:heme A synthase
MSEIEVPIESVQEEIHHHALHDNSKMISRAAIMSAFLAVFAAIAALFAGHYSNEALIEQIQSSNQWGYYQAKGIKGAIAEMKDDSAKVAKYKEEQVEIKKEAEIMTAESEHHLRKHVSLATAVTFFQVSIGLIAVSILSKRKHFLTLALGLSGFGLFWFVKGFLI